MISPEPRSVLSIDIGNKRIGLAGCDPLGITVNPLPPLFRTKFNKDLEVLRMHCLSRKVQGLVIGMPLDDHGYMTKQAHKCSSYGKRIATVLDLPIAWVNEHTSSWSARERFNKLKSDRSGQLDSAVAVLLLEQWLREGPELKSIHMATPERDLRTAIVEAELNERKL